MKKWFNFIKKSINTLDYTHINSKILKKVD